MEETKNRVKRDSFLAPWDEVAFHLIKYITYEIRYTMSYAYHFKSLNQLRNQPHQKPKENLSVSYFFLQSLGEMSEKFQARNIETVALPGIVKLLVCDVLSRHFF